MTKETEFQQMRDNPSINKSANKFLEAGGHFPDKGFQGKEGTVLGVVITLQKLYGPITPIQNLVWMLKLMIPHIHQKVGTGLFTQQGGFLGR